jgi:hypothetical protein
MSTSAQLADHILSKLAGPHTFSAPATRASKFTPYRADIDEGLRRLCAERKPNQTFSQAEIAARVGCHRKLIQLVERRAYYKFVRRLIEIDPAIAEQSLGNLVTMEDVLRIHHPASTRVSARQAGDFDSRFRARRVHKITRKGAILLEDTIKLVEDRKARATAYGRRISADQLSKIRAERMARQRAEQEASK